MAQRIMVSSLLIIILFATSPSSYSNNQTDLEALLAFKNSIQEDPFRALASWNLTTHFCSWNGISCSKTHPNRVVSVSMRHQGLVGSLSPHIANLSFLRNINLQNNTFHGHIPQEIGRLRRLRMIEFSNNSFGGEIPRNLSQCRNLFYLNLIDNKLIGSIFPEIGSLVDLEHLGLTLNMLLGSILSSLGNLTKLVQLSVSDCGLQGDIPESLGQLRRLRLLNLGENNLTGWVPLGLYNLSGLEIFFVAANRLHGRVPSGVDFKLPMLRGLGLRENYFTGPLSTSLSNSSQIEYIGVRDNNFTGKLIDLSRLSALKSLTASRNRLEGDIDAILSSLVNCTTLLSIALYGNLFTGSLPDTIGNLSTRLQTLSIGDNQLSGSIPSSIGDIVSLSFVSFPINNLQGPIPSSISKLHNLQEIWLFANSLTNEKPLSFSNLTILNILSLGQNNLSGSIPPSLSNCTNLLRLDFSDNNFNGSIPPEIMKISSISILLDLSYNVLTGAIPPEVGSLRNLGILDLSHNRLSGFLSSSLSSCVKMESLLLESNCFQGEIPDSLRALRGLQYLDLSQNNFSGKIPKFLSELRLLNLNLSFNALSGEVPTFGIFRNGSAISLEGNPALCGGIATLNLSSCSSTNSNKKKFLKFLIPTSGVICLVLLCCLCAIIYWRRTSKTVQTPANTFAVPEFLRLSYADLLNATDGFSDTNLVGAGRFGSVYRGSINVNDDEQTLIAVKVFNLNQRGASRSLVSECNALRGIRHRNLLKILSVCDSVDFQGEDFKALIYELMVNGSLENWLHQDSEEESRILSTIQRLDIAIDIASAVEYLHCGSDSIVIHGDLKPSNILLDEDMAAHIGDFGLAKIISSISENLPTADGSSSAAISGTIGYIPPEYGMNTIVSTQGDAYSYGILLLEMFTNRRPTSDAFINLRDFVSSALPDSAMEVVDPFLHQEHNNNDIYRACIVSILGIGVRCSNRLPRDRMLMAKVVIELKNVRKMFLAAPN